MIVAGIEEAETLVGRFVTTRYEQRRNEGPDVELFSEPFDSLAVVFSKRPTLLHFE